MQETPFYITGLQQGDIVMAEPFDGREPVPIKVVSGRVAGGGAAHILKGEIQSQEPRDDLPQLVAIKVILTLSPNNVDKERIRRELAAVERAQHPYILPFIGSRTTGGYTILISGFMDNGNMLEYIQANPAVSKEHLICQVADAVAYLHDALKLVHGDLKCQNVLISDNGDALLADFGLTTTAGDPLTGEITATAIRKSSTRRFAAPELFVDGAKSPSGEIRSKTTHTDVFAFGMLIIQTFTRARPWPDLEDDYEIGSKLFNREPYPRPANSTEIGFNDPWWRLCLTCIKFEPEERPTMRKIHSQLRTILGTAEEGPNVEKKVTDEPSGSTGKGQSVTTDTYRADAFSARLASLFRRRSNPKPLLGLPVTFDRAYSPSKVRVHIDSRNPVHENAEQRLRLYQIDEENYLKFEQLTRSCSLIGAKKPGYKDANAWLLDAIRGPQKALEQLPPAERDWLAVVNAFQMCPLLVPRSGLLVDRAEEYTVGRRSWFKKDKVHQSVSEKLVAWFSRFWADFDMEHGPGAEDRKAIQDIVAHAGRALDAGGAVNKTERQTKTVLDIGVLRYPDIVCPYIKVYRIELVACYESTTVGAYTHDQNGLIASFQLQQYEPDPKAIEGVRPIWRQNAVDDLVRRYHG